MQQTQENTREAPAGPPSSSGKASSSLTQPSPAPLSKKARRKASMIKWRLEKQQQEQVAKDPQTNDTSFDFEAEGEEEDFYRLKNNARSKFPWNKPTTALSTRARWTTLETRLNERWQADKVGHPQADSGPSFVILDGPPYANGSIHLGHVLNKVLKDAICKYKRMNGFNVEYRVGWDCHGLPIEKLLSHGEGTDHKGASSVEETLELLQKCKAHASKWVEKQKQSFKKLGVLADFDSAYRTDDPRYQAMIVRAFAKFVEGGYVEHSMRPVPWCITCKTVLAHAEISHLTIVDPSCYVFFPCSDAEKLLSLFGVDPIENQAEVGFLVWTTSPWSLPLNRGVAVNPSLDYCLISLESTLAGHDNNPAPFARRFFVVAKDCVNIVKQSVKESLPSDVSVSVVGKPVKATLLAATLPTVGHPVMDKMSVPVVLHPKVSAKIGTAILHVAPGCCEEDYLLGKEHSLEICCPMDEQGRFTDEVGIPGLQGLAVPEANLWVLEDLKAKGYLILQSGEVAHTSPHCWRCNNPLLFRMTQQWFINLNHNGLFDLGQKEVKKSSVSFYPPKSKNQFLTTVACRPLDWCISRQRRWGVPIPALLCGSCNRGYTSPSFALKVAELLESNGGIEFYWREIVSCKSFSELCARFPAFEAGDFQCPACGHCALNEDSVEKEEAEQDLCFRSHGRTRLEKDIFDVWFDSGVAGFASKALHCRHGDRGNDAPIADMVCEGQDQQRGWYQALLFCSLVLDDGRMPASSFLTHSFVVGQDKKKLSKSTQPSSEEQEGAQSRPNPHPHLAFHDTVVGRKPDDFCGDMLRLWACSSKYATNVIMCDELYRTLRKKYMLLRHTTWFLLANMADFAFKEDAVPLDKLSPYDRFSLSILHRMETKAHQAYEAHDFATVCSLLLDYLQKDLRPVYLINAKSTLYFEKPDSPLRRSAQTTLWYIARTLAQLWAPILSFYAEQVNDEISRHHVTRNSGGKPQLPSIHLQRFERLQDPLESAKEKCTWISLEKLRKLVTAEIEEKRKEGAFSRNEYAKVSVTLFNLPPPPPPAALDGHPTEGKATPKAKGKAKAKVKKDAASFDDDCLNVKTFLEELPSEEERTRFLCSYFNVSQCELQFVAAPSTTTTTTTTATATATNGKQGGKEKKKKKGGKEEAGGGAGQGAALKDRVVIVASEADGKLCCRCDTYYVCEEDNNHAQHKELLAGSPPTALNGVNGCATNGNGHHHVPSSGGKKKHLGICGHCKDQLA